jgi:hypothetical protein
LRHRLRAILLKNWKRGTTMYRELKALGASDADAHRVAANSTGRCRSRTSIGSASPVSHDLNCSNRPVRTRMPGGVGGVRSTMISPYPDARQAVTGISAITLRFDTRGKAPPCDSALDMAHALGFDNRFPTGRNRTIPTPAASR